MGTEIVPLRVPYYGQPNSAPRGTISVPFFSECVINMQNAWKWLFFLCPITLLKIIISILFLAVLEIPH